MFAVVSARGSALFVDEARTEALSARQRAGLRPIALDNIMKFAEEHRNVTIIALAGYAGGINRLLSANAGPSIAIPGQG